MKSSPGVKIVRVGAARAPAPIIRVTAPAAKTSRTRRVARRVGSVAGGLARTEEAHLLAALALGFAIKQGLLEKIPRFLGMGPVTNYGVVTYVVQKMGLWRGMPDIVRDTGRTARLLAAFQLGKGEALAGVDGAEWGSEYDNVHGAGSYAAYG